MKRNKKWLFSLVAGAALLLLSPAGTSAQGTVILSDFHNFNLSATYANWDAAGSDPFNGGSGFTPVITSGPTSYEIKAQGYGSGAYNFATPISAPGATRWSLTFTINNPMQHGDGSGLWFGPNADISDSTHQVALTSDNAGGGFRSYGPFVGGNTYTLTGPLGDLDVNNITAFNLELDPAEYGGGAPYDITYRSFSVSSVPEPASFALLGLGAAALVMARKSRSQKG
jgi:hypothetical protein